MTTYTVQSSDTLGKIAKAHNTTVENLVKLNNITDPNSISIGQKLNLGEVSQTTNSPVQTPEEKPMFGFDTFQKESKSDASSTYAPLAYALGGAAAYQGGKYLFPKIKDAAETVQLRYMYGKDAAKGYVKGAVGKSKETATAVRNFVANKAKHAAKSAELHYAFGKDAVKNGVEKGKTAAQNVANNVTQKAKHAVKSAELHYAFGKDAVKNGAKKAVKKGKVITRYTRFMGNTKIAPKLIKGAGKYAGPAAAVYGMYEVAQAYKKGGEKAAVKQAVKTGSGLAGGWAGAKVGAAIGSFAGPVGTVVGGVVGGVAGYILGEKLVS